MPLAFHAFWLSKRGSSADECEDAFAADTAAGRFAVADGATESVFARSWAQFLVDQFVANVDCDPEQWTVWLPPVQERWSAGFLGRQLPWYAEVKLQQGAFATFLGVVLHPSAETTCHWRAVAVGDTCLFHTRATSLLSAFPLTVSAQFGDSPWLLGSRTPSEEVSQTRALRAEGLACPEDRLWLMTDALAQWFLSDHEAGKEPWEEMEPLLAPPASNERFAAWIEELRDAGRLRNDDVTLLAINL